MKSQPEGMVKDRREHRIELRQKITALKDEINALKAVETNDEEKQTEVQEAISELKIKLKECDMEKDAIENFNHTQFLNNVKVSDANKDRYSDEATGNTRFFDHLTGSTASVTDGSETKEAETDAGDPLLETDRSSDTSPPEPKVEPSEASPDGNRQDTTESKNPPSPVSLPPNTIV